ncbi:ABC transporter permease subunit [Candidatus Peregrinibacteria bacterium]|nr:ABC transporter permease subunit [Candidatus Peregrinibacteria bacterium]
MNFKHISTIMHKELCGYFNSPLAYIFITVFLTLTSWLFFRGFFIDNVASMRPFFTFLPWVFLFLIPAVTMRLWAEEQKAGTLEILLTAPLNEWEAVLGKFLASFAFLVITLLLSLVLPIILFFIGEPDWGMIAGGYFGAVFLGGAYLAIGLWISSLTQNQITAFILSVLMIFIFFIIGEPVVLHTAPPFLLSVFKYLGLGSHFSSILRGVIDSRDLIYYLTFIGFFLYLNVTSLNSRKWH